MNNYYDKDYDKNTDIITSAVCLVILIGFFLLFIFGGDKAYYEVHKSNTTQECVKVIKYDEKTPNGEEFGCGSLPEKYTLVWVK